MDQDFAFRLTCAAVLALGIDPLVQTMVSALPPSTSNNGDVDSHNSNHNNSINGSTTKTTKGKRAAVVYADSMALLNAATNGLSRAAQVYGGLLLLDSWVLPFFEKDDQQGDNDSNMGHLLPAGSSLRLKDAALHISITLWAAFTMCSIKHSVFLNYVAGKRLGRVSLMDTILDFVVMSVALAHILSVLEIDWGVGLRSLFAAGGTMALMVSLASRDLAEQMVSGLLVKTWDAFDTAEYIRLGDGIEGKVTAIGLVETCILGYDNITTHIPNSQICRTRLCNLSRVQKSQVKQILRFKYSDLEKLPMVLQDILEQIRQDCTPQYKLIVDGSKPFVAWLTEYKPDHIQGMVNTHFEGVQPNTVAYQEIRQRVMLAIAKAMKKHGVEFALPSTIYYQK
ncbi:hypothetical protein ACA910_007675 [Epithemia clementina (nom. ined.)]